MYHFQFPCEGSQRVKAVIHILTFTLFMCMSVCIWVYVCVAAHITYVHPEVNLGLYSSGTIHLVLIIN